MSHSSLDSPTEILQLAVSPPPYTPPPLTELSHKQKLQWRENARSLMDATIDKWTYPSVPLTAIEDIHNSARIAARLVKIWALAQSDPTQRDLADVKYHMDVTAPRGRVADKRSSSRFDLGNRGKVLQVLGTSRKGSSSGLSFHNSEIGAEVREGDKNLD